MARSPQVLTIPPFLARSRRTLRLDRRFVAMSAESTASDSPARSFFTDRYRKLRADIASDIRQQQDAGTIAADVDPEVIRITAHRCG